MTLADGRIVRIFLFRDDADGEARMVILVALGVIVGVEVLCDGFLSCLEWSQWCEPPVDFLQI